MNGHFTKLKKIGRYEGVLFWPKTLWRTIQYTYNKHIRNKRYATQKVHGHVMTLDLHDPGISRALYILGDREKEHRYLLKKTIPGKRIVLDLGANIGYYVLLESKFLRSDAHIIAVEPVSQNVSLLEKNLAQNNISHATIIHGAVADVDGTTNIHLSSHSNVHSLIKDPTSKQTGKTERINTYSLKTLKNTFGAIDFIRMDIEGYEIQILQSLIALNEHDTFQPTILFELHRKSYDESLFRDLIQNLYDTGYMIKYAALSTRETATKHQLPIVENIHTDGTTRHIVENIPEPSAFDVLWTSRCAVLAPK